MAKSCCGVSAELNSASGPVLYYSGEFAQRASSYAPWCELQQVRQAPVVTEPALYLDRQGMWLCMPGHSTPFQPSHAELLRRAQGTGPRTELVRACGKSMAGLRILDACAGFGSDGLLLALLGAKVCLVERQPLIWIMLHERARHFTDTQVICDEAEAVLARPVDEGSAGPWDVILLDPMFPPRSKKALPNRGLQHLRELTQSHHESADVETLLRLALNRTGGRVVLKRRLRDGVLLAPDFQIKGKSVRFDVYQGREES